MGLLLEDLTRIVRLQEGGHADRRGSCLSLLQRMMNKERRERGADDDQNGLQFLDHGTAPVPYRSSRARRLTARARDRNALQRLRSCTRLWSAGQCGALRNRRARLEAPSGAATARSVLDADIPRLSRPTRTRSRSPGAIPVPAVNSRSSGLSFARVLGSLDRTSSVTAQANGPRCERSRCVNGSVGVLRRNPTLASLPAAHVPQPATPRCRP